MLFPRLVNFDRECLCLFVFPLQTLAAARMLTATGPVGQTHWGDSAANNSSSATHSADAQLKVFVVASFAVDSLAVHF